MPRDSIFISYSRKDSNWLLEVKQRLAVLEHFKDLEVWDDTKIKTWNNWRSEIERSIKNCKVALLLVSNNFLSSEFILKNELPRILAAANREGLVIFNILIDRCPYELTALETYQCLNDPERPLEELSVPDRKRLLVDMVKQLSSILPNSTAAGSLNGTPERIEEASLFDLILVLSFIIKNGHQTITDIQKQMPFERKIVVLALDKLQREGYIIKHQDKDPNKKPSTLWKASPIGITKFADFRSNYDKINH